MRNSTTMSAASADVSRMAALYQESRDQYIPQVFFGSGLAYSFGFPLGEPSIFKVSSTSLLLNQAQREFIRSARADVRAADLTKEDQEEPGDPGDRAFVFGIGQEPGVDQYPAATGRCCGEV